MRQASGSAEPRPIKKTHPGVVHWAFDLVWSDDVNARRLSEHQMQVEVLGKRLGYRLRGRSEDPRESCQMQEQARQYLQDLYAHMSEVQKRTIDHDILVDATARSTRGHQVGKAQRP
jgi:hypothetical protein